MGSLSRLSSCLTNLRHMGHLTLRFLRIKENLHVKLLETGCTESMSTMDHYTRDSDEDIIILFAQLTLVFVDEFVHKLLDLRGWFSCDLLCLFEEESSWVFEGFHGLIKYFCWLIECVI